MEMAPWFSDMAVLSLLTLICIALGIFLFSFVQLKRQSKNQYWVSYNLQLFLLLNEAQIVTVDDNRMGPLYKHVFPPIFASRAILCSYTMEARLNSKMSSAIVLICLRLHQ